MRHIRSLIRTKDYWRKIARKSNDPLDWAAYKNFKREVKRELRLAEREHVENQIRNNPIQGVSGKRYDHVSPENL